MPSDEEKLKSIKAEIRSLIVSSPVGLTIEKFMRDYKECIGSTLPFKDFRHNNAQDFLNSMPDVVQLKKTASGTLLVPVENKLVSHINDLVSNQRRTTKQRKKTTFKPRMTTFDNRRYYQVISCKNKNRRRKKRNNIRPEGLESTDSSVGLDDIDNLHIDWTTEYPKNHFSNIMSYGQTNQFSPPRRPSPISIHEDKLSKTIRSPQNTTTREEYDYHENSDECRTSEFYAVSKTNCCTLQNLPSSESESGVESDHSFSFDYKSGCNSTGGSADNESSVSIFDTCYQTQYHSISHSSSSYKEDSELSSQSPDSTFGDIPSTLEEGTQKFAAYKYGQTLYYGPIRSSCSKKKDMEPSFQLLPKSSRSSSDTAITLKGDNQKSSTTSKSNSVKCECREHFYVEDKKIETQEDFKLPSFPYLPKNCTESKSLANKHGKKGNDFYISKEHELYLTALAHGIVLDPSKIIDPYKHVLSLVQRPKISDDVDINLIQNLKIRDDVDNNLTQSPEIRDINTSSTSLKELNIGSNVDDKYAANIDVMKINNKIISHTDKIHCSNENMENKSILRNDSSEALNERNVNENSSQESICERNYFHPENEISKENTVGKLLVEKNTLSGTGRGLFSEQYLQTKKKQLGSTNEKLSPSLSFGRGLALRNLLKSYEEGKSKSLGGSSSGTNNHRDGIGRGQFLKIMQTKYFHYP